MSIFDTAVQSLANSKQGLLKAGVPLAFGGLNGVGGVGSAVLTDLGNILSGDAQAELMKNPIPLLGGGVTLHEARQIITLAGMVKRSRKNWFNIAITDLQPTYIDSAGIKQTKKYSPDINFFATDFDYGNGLDGNSVQVGTGFFDTVSGRSHIEMRLTALDDQDGTIKQWFNERLNIAAHRDGIQGLPIEYLMRVQVTHGYIGNNIAGAKNAYIDTFLARPGTIDKSGSRREDNLQELPITLVQFDSFAHY